MKEENPEFTIFPLFTSKEEKEDWEQLDIFRSKIKCSSKSCNVVIDDVCSNSFIARETFDKLQISTEVHPKLYFITCTNRPTIRCLVLLKMSSYEAYVWCDVILMTINIFFRDNHGFVTIMQRDIKKPKWTPSLTPRGTKG